MNSSKTKIIFVEGNIGAGKTTLLKHLKNLQEFSEENNYNFILEPLEEYRNLPLYNNSFLKHKKENNTKIETFNVLDKFYKKELSGFHNQIYFISVIFLNMFDNIKEGKINIIERSIFSAIYIFSKTMYNLNIISQVEISIIQNYKKVLEKLLENKDVTFIFLDTDYEECKKRIIKRERPEEMSITKDYLKLLNDSHLEMKEEMKMNYKVKELNTRNRPVEELTKDFKNFI